MAAAALKQGTDTELRTLLNRVVRAIDETLSSLIGREIHVEPGEVLCQDPADLQRGLKAAYVAARGAMDKSYEGKSMLTLFEVPDAVAMAGLLMMTPEDVIAQRRESDRLDGEDIEAFGELGNVLYSGFSDALRDKVEDFGVRMQDQGHVGSDADPDGMLSEDRLVTIHFKMKVGDYPESTATFAVDLDTAERWNGAPIEVVGDPEPQEATDAADEDGFESIPAAPIRGALAAYVTQTEIFRMLRLSGRRVGLQVRRHGRGEIPNPAAHRNEVVVLDVPPGEERRFDWCSRVKELSPTTKVVLLIHHASRPRVTQAFLSRADAILAYPCEELELSERLEHIVSDLVAATAQPTDED